MAFLGQYRFESIDFLFFVLLIQNLLHCSLGFLPFTLKIKVFMDCNLLEPAGWRLGGRFSVLFLIFDNGAGSLMPSCDI